MVLKFVQRTIKHSSFIPSIRKTYTDDVISALTSDGDSRLDLDVMGVNQYGVAPYPVPGLISFASTTANTISLLGYSTAMTLYATLNEARAVGRFHTAIADCYAQITSEIASNLGLQDGIGVIPLASGTDAVLYATWLVARDAERSVHSILVGAFETGSGVPLAARGCHHSLRTPSGLAVKRGAYAFPIGCELSTEDITLRRLDGTALEQEEIDTAVSKAVEKAVSEGRHVLLHQVESSKTGLVGISMPQIDELVECYPGLITVLVDACQMRVDCERLHSYLHRGFSVIITGSKFLGGPPFSGALLVPYAKEPLPTLPGYVDPVPRGFGLALRWQAALAEWRRYASCTPVEQKRVKIRFGTLVEQALDRLDGARLVDDHNSAACSIRSIFSFLLSDENGVLVGLAEARRIHRDLMRPIKGAKALIHLGQPVALGGEAGFAALRIAIDARMIADFCDPQHGESAFQKTEAELDQTVSKIKLLLKR